MALVIGAIAAIFGGMKMLEEYENKVKVDEPKVELIIQENVVQELAPKTQINYTPEVSEDWNEEKKAKLKEKKRRQRQKLADALDEKMSKNFKSLENKIYEMWIPKKDDGVPISRQRVDREALENLMDTPSENPIENQ